ncbi:MAG: hypothetical protein JNL11_03505 [Bdellovibrionaceae bacterium]|nr:hypothetical protein [Pseudobdellovibrionaceae bacterium]
MNQKLEKIILALKAKNALPKKMEFTSVGPYTFANVYDELNSPFISDSVACGFDLDPATALLKSLSEFIEGKAFKQGFKRAISSCLTERSHGFAAYPKCELLYEQQAQMNARNEAVERLVWSNWWDDESIAFSKKDLSQIKLNLNEKAFCAEIQKSYSVEKIIAVYPHFEKTRSENLIIFVGYLNNGGVISGGACGEDENKTIDRALSELFRHGLAVKRMRENSLVPETFYEKRLWYFSTLDGQNLVDSRLSKTGFNKIKLPSGKFSEEIPHSLSDLFYVHRYLFDNQPEFMGGRLERFCI